VYRDELNYSIGRHPATIWKPCTPVCLCQVQLQLQSSSPWSSDEHANQLLISLSKHSFEKILRNQKNSGISQEVPAKNQEVPTKNQEVPAKTKKFLVKTKN
jgi:hypothetical protein